MSEKNKNIFENDLLMRAILEGGQEEVPSRVWDAVSERLDKAETKTVRKPNTLWWRRAGVAAAAIAAAVAAVVFVDRGEDPVDVLPLTTQGDMIAVVEPETVVMEETEIEVEKIISQTSGAELLAYVPTSKTQSTEYVEQFVSVEDVIAAESPSSTTQDQTDVTTVRHTEVTPKSNADEVWQTLEDWE